MTKLQALKSEVDALQVAVMAEHKPWFKQVSTLVAILALLFSFSTTYVSYQRTKAEDIRSLRAELRGLLQRMVGLPKENLEIQTKYRDHPSNIVLASGVIATENTFITQQAAAVAKSLPEGQIFASEYYALAFALQATNDNEAALDFYRLAAEKAEDFNTRVNSLRGYASVCYITGKTDEGRKTILTAIKEVETAKNQSSDTIQLTNGLTYLGQAVSESQGGFAENAKKSLQNAEDTIRTSAMARQILEPQINAMKKQLQKNKTLTMPSTATP